VYGDNHYIKTRKSLA